MNEQDIVRSHTYGPWCGRYFACLCIWTLLMCPISLPSSMRPDFEFNSRSGPSCWPLNPPLKPTTSKKPTGRAVMEVRFVELASGNFVEGQSNSLEMTNKDTMVQLRNLTPEADAVGLKALESVAPCIFETLARGAGDTIILPVRGYGVWSTLHGYLALKSVIAFGTRTLFPACRNAWPGGTYR